MPPPNPPCPPADHPVAPASPGKPAREPRSRRSELVLALGWALVLLKCAAVWWACRHYPVPFSAWWLILPTLLFASLCTWIYVRRD